MDLAPLVPWLSLAALVISVGTSVTTLLTSGTKSNATKLADHERRIQTLEGDMKHLPDRATAHRLELAIEKLSGRVDTMSESLKPVAATSVRLQEFLLDQAAEGRAK